MLDAHVYAVHEVTRRVVGRFGRSERAVERAVDYVLRAHALNQYAAIRQGFAPNVCYPLAVMSRTGPQIKIGADIDAAPRSSWKAGGRWHGKPIAQQTVTEIAYPFSESKDMAVAELARKYPKTWARYWNGFFY